MVYELCYNGNLRRVQQDFRSLIRPIHYLEVSETMSVDENELCLFVKRAIINHCRIYHDGQYSNIEDYLLAVTQPNCSCFGVICRADVDPSRVPHWTLQNFKQKSL